MRIRLLLLVVTGVSTLAASTVDAATRLTYEIGGNPRAIAWNGAPIPIKVDQSAFGDAVSMSAVGRSLRAWQEIEGGNVRFDRGVVPSAKPGADGTSVITAVDELFDMSGFMAFTTAWFDDEGVIREADIQIDRELGKTALEQLLTHELGHLLGLDHSGVISAAMFPFVDVSAPIHLERDDRLAVRQIYPQSGAKPEGSWIEGRIENSYAPLWGVQVVAVDDMGKVHGTALTSADGRYTIGPVEPGRYRIYVEPMDGPVTRRNLSGAWLKISGEPFNTTFAYPEPVAIGEGQRREVDIRVLEAPVNLNPKWIGIRERGSNELSLDSLAARVRAGDTIDLVVGGDGFVSGMTRFDVPAPGVRRTSEFSYGPSFVWATFEIAADVPPSALTIVVENGSETAALTGGLRVMEGDAPERRRGSRRG